MRMVHALHPHHAHLHHISCARLLMSQATDINGLTLDICLDRADVDECCLITSNVFVRAECEKFVSAQTLSCIYNERLYIV